MREVEAAERLAKEEAQRGPLRFHLRCSATLPQLVDLEAAQVLRRCCFGRAAEKPGERLDVLDIVVPRLLAEPAYSHVLEHATTQIADGLVLHGDGSLRLG